MFDHAKLASLSAPTHSALLRDFELCLPLGKLSMTICALLSYSDRKLLPSSNVVRTSTPTDFLEIPKINQLGEVGSGSAL